MQGLALAMALSGALLADVYEASLCRTPRSSPASPTTPAPHRQISNALGIRDATAARSLTRLTETVLIVQETENEVRALQSFQLSA